MRSKVCSKCGVARPVTEFSIDKSRSDGRRDRCRTCDSKYHSEYYREHKGAVLRSSKRYYDTNKDKVLDRGKRNRIDKTEFINGLKTPCRKCGESRLYVIDFHHIDPKEKSFSISYKPSKVNIEKEVKKCVCLCRNCHSEFHYLYGNVPVKPKDALYEYLGGE